MRLENTLTQDLLLRQPRIGEYVIWQVFGQSVRPCRSHDYSDGCYSSEYRIKVLEYLHWESFDDCQ